MSMRTYKYRMYPTNSQASFLEDQLREACDLYNCALQERIGAWKIGRQSITFYDQDKQLKPLRAAGLVGIPDFSCARDVLRRVDRAFKAFFRRCKRGEHPGFPRYRASRRYDSITFPEVGKGWRLMPNGKLRIRGAGHIRINLHRPIVGTIKMATIKRDAGRWFVCFCVERDALPLPDSTEAVGVDVGLTTFAVLSNGIQIANPRHGKTAHAHLRRCQRKLARRKKGSTRRRKSVLETQRAFAHIRNQRADFAHKESRKIVDRFGLIVVEDLNVKGLTGGMLGTSVRDASWGSFFHCLAYKAEDAGREFVKIDPRGTSQECTCGASVPKSLSDRWHSCPKCGREGPRDLISSQVILSRAGNRPSGANVEVVNSCVA